MRILADENIPYVREAFQELGDVHTLSGRAIDAEAVRDADMLLVRSITNVNALLLEGSGVRFVATATIGEDHIDKAHLAERGIAFSSAPGCNAIGNVVNRGPAEVEIGQRVRAIFEEATNPDTGDELLIPNWEAI